MSTTNTTVFVTKSYVTSSLAQLFANFLLGNVSRNLNVQKHIQLYTLTSEELIQHYEKNQALPVDNAILGNAIPVRVSHLSTSKNDTTVDEYYATFISTIDGSEISVPSVSSSIAIGLQAGHLLLASATLDPVVYRDIRDGSRAEIRWKIGTNSTFTSQGDE